MSVLQSDSSVRLIFAPQTAICCFPRRCWRFRNRRSILPWKQRTPCQARGRRGCHGSEHLHCRFAGESHNHANDFIVADYCAQPYYNYFTHEIHFGSATGGTRITVAAPLGSVPVFHHGGSILPRRDLVRRSSILSWRDPITLVVAVDSTGKSAQGSLYLDDGESYDYERGDYVARRFSLAESSSQKLLLRSSTLDTDKRAGVAHDPANNQWAQKIADVAVREVVILGLESKPSCVKLSGSVNGLEFDWHDGVAASASRRKGGKAASKLVIKDAGAAIIHDWTIELDLSGTSCDVTPAIDYEAALQSPECPVGQFRCRNEGHIPSCILRSRVNDGICDPECCDGSDEFDGKVMCQDVCQRVGFEHKKKVAEEARKKRVGIALRNGYIEHGMKEKQKLEKEVAKVRGEIEDLEDKERSLKARLEALEQAEEAEIERKKESVLYQKIVEMQDAIKALRLHRANLEGHVSDLSGILSDLSVSMRSL